LVLTAATVFPDMSGQTIVVGLAAGTILGVLGFVLFTVWRPKNAHTAAAPNGIQPARASWRMPPLEKLTAPRFSLSKRLWMGVLRAYLAGAVILVVVKAVQMAINQ
jgi:hypothetical protein